MCYSLPKNLDERITLTLKIFRKPFTSLSPPGRGCGRGEREAPSLQGGGTCAPLSGSSWGAGPFEPQLQPLVVNVKQKQQKPPETSGFLGVGTRAECGHTCQHRPGNVAPHHPQGPGPCPPQQLLPVTTGGARLAPPAHVRSSSQEPPWFRPVTQVCVLVPVKYLS